ncbi:MAG TPA: S1C family serine protease [Rhizomicrobium sp.]|nr:S1C family serine protease [Rhizomicrobium sp.]
MTRNSGDALEAFSQALAARAAAARVLVAEIRTANRGFRSATVWRPGILVTSEQSLPKAESYDVTLSDVVRVAATPVGRDPGTNVAVLKFDGAGSYTLPGRGEAQVGAIALAYGADGRGGIAAHIGIVSAVGPEWRSRAGGKIDSRVNLDIAVTTHDDGGPVLDASGALLGISTLGHGDTVLAIPPETVERSVDALLAHGRVERGWLGVALQPVAIPDAWRETAAAKSGLMVMSTVADGPAAAAGLLAGDILLSLDGAPATHVRQLAERLGSDSVGRTIEIGALRSGTRVPLRATVAARPADG